MTLSIDIVSIILFTLTLTAFFVRKNLFAPEVIFPAMWTVSTFLSSMRLYELDEIQDNRTCWIILIGTISFVIGSLSNQKLKRKIRSKNIREYNKAILQTKDIKLLFSEKFLFWLFLFFLMFYVQDILRVINALRSGIGFDLLRGAYYGLNAGEEFNKSDSVLRTYISSFVMGIQSVFSVVCIQYFTIDVKKYKKCFLYALVLLLITVFVSAGRLEIVMFALRVIVSFAISRGESINAYISKKIDQIKLMKRQNIIIILLILGTVSAILYMTEQRGINSGVEFGRHIYIYLAGGITLMDKRLALLDYNGFTYSAAGFYGLWSLVMPILHFIGFRYPDIYNNAVYGVIEPLQMPVRIGYKSYMNAFVTTFFHVFADFGWLGLFFGMFLWGTIAGKSFEGMKRDFFGSDTVIYLLFIGVMLLGINHYPFVSRGNIIAFIMVWIMKSKRIKFI